MNKILFICHGNICRSTMAEFVMKDLVRKAGREKEFEIASAATSREEIGHDIHHGTKAILQAKGISFASRQAVQMTKNDYRYYDLIVAMDKENLWGISRIIDFDRDNKVKLLLSYAGESAGEVADPWYTGDFEATYRDVLAGCQGILDSYPPIEENTRKDDNLNE